MPSEEDLASSASSFDSSLLAADPNPAMEPTTTTDVRPVLPLPASPPRPVHSPVTTSPAQVQRPVVLSPNAFFSHVSSLLAGDREPTALEFALAGYLVSQLPAFQLDGPTALATALAAQWPRLPSGLPYPRDRLPMALVLEALGAPANDLLAAIESQLGL